MFGNRCCQRCSREALHFFTGFPFPLSDGGRTSSEKSGPLDNKLRYAGEVLPERVRACDSLRIICPPPDAVELFGDDMRGLHDLRNHFVDGPNSIGERSRARRWEMLQTVFPNLESMSVLDLGGTIETWKRAPVQPCRVHVVNLQAEEAPLPSWAQFDLADACALPPHILEASYDLVFSNSVIEHVGGHAQRLRFASAVRDLGRSYWVQTPYRYFPVEPHWVAPCMQFLPLPARVRFARHWPLAHTPPQTYADAIEGVMSVELLGRAEMRFYFPDADILVDRLVGLPKSLVSVRHLRRQAAAQISS